MKEPSATVPTMSLRHTVKKVFVAQLQVIDLGKGDPGGSL